MVRLRRSSPSDAGWTRRRAGTGFVYVDARGDRLGDEERAPAVPLPPRLAGPPLGYFRIGNDVYADENGSFGLTTLEPHHVRRRKGNLLFEFIGKSGIEHSVEIDDPLAVDAVATMRRPRTSAPGTRRNSYVDPTVIDAYEEGPDEPRRHPAYPRHP